MTLQNVVCNMEINFFQEQVLKVCPWSKIFPSNKSKITKLTFFLYKILFCFKAFFCLLLYASTYLTLQANANENVLSLTALEILPSALTVTDSNMINCYFIIDKTKWNLERKKEKEGEENAKWRLRAHG